MGNNNNSNIPTWVPYAGIFTIFGLLGLSFAANIYRLSTNTDTYYYDSIVISNGELTNTHDNISKEYHSEDYKVIHQDNNSLVIFVYGSDPGKRFMYSEYILDNINVTQNDDGTYSVNFDPESLSEEDYKEFAIDYKAGKTETGIKRVRS